MMQFQQMNMYQGKKPYNKPQNKQGFRGNPKGGNQQPPSSQGLEMAKKHNPDLEFINDKNLEIPENSKF